MTERRRSSRLHGEATASLSLQPSPANSKIDSAPSTVQRIQRSTAKRKLFDTDNPPQDKDKKRRRGRPPLHKVVLTNDGLPITSLLCQFCTGDEDENRKGEAEGLLRCSVCLESAHPSCLSMSNELSKAAFLYDWQCFSCKSCQQCHSSAQTKHMLFCDSCDRGFHTFCLKPALKQPPEGEWTCPLCKRQAASVNGANTPPEVEVKAVGTKATSPFSSGQEEKATEHKDGNATAFEQQKDKKRRRSTVIVRRQKSSDRKRNAKKEPAQGEEEAGNGAKPATGVRGVAPEEKETTELADFSEQLKSVEAQLSGCAPAEELTYFLQAFSAAHAQSMREQSSFVGNREEEELVGSVRTLRSVCINNNEMETRFTSPYPDEFASLSRLFLCSFCLLPTSSPFMLRRHMAKCQARHPPGCEIYRKERLAIFEVDGAKSKDYCQRLCLLAKLFLHHKTLYHQVEPFLFYVVTDIERAGCQLVGYFSKEKESEKSYNVSCILVLPPYMRMGYGRIMIDLSYALSRREGKTGSPERPLSDLGLVSYRAYWKSVILQHLKQLGLGQHTISIKALSQRTAITASDLISTLQWMGKLKYWRGDHIVLLDSQSATPKSSSSRPLCRIDEKALRWKPPL